MLIIIDKKTRKVITNHGTNSMFPDGNIPNLKLKDNEEAIRINDNSQTAKDIMNSHSYYFNENNELVIEKTIEQYRQEYNNSNKGKRENILKQLQELDKSFLDARLIEDLIDGNEIPQNKIDIVTQKKALRQQLKELEV